MNQAVLVIGAGIAGIQTSIDLAQMGFPVYLVERTPAIGGRMAQLDKTFPTNDCAICILAPKMIECAGHKNVHLLTYSEVVGVEGQAGNFRVKVLKKPRYVEASRCTGCGDCASECPVEVPSEFNVGLGMRKAVYVPFPQAVPNTYTVDKQGIPPCRARCPALVDAQGYVALISQGKFDLARDLVRRRNPFVSVCGRVCHHPCESACNRGQFDEPISICTLKRTAADLAMPEEERPAPSPERTPLFHNEEKVAIVGGGPAGLTAASDLAGLGYGVTLFEALPVLGGMLVTGIPAYRLPREALQKDLDYILSSGFEVRLNTAIGQEVSLDGLVKEYDAVFLAVGAHRSGKMYIPGEDLQGVLQGVDFLRKMNLGKGARPGRKVMVIGGGNVAIDAARSALRLGAERVSVLYRRSRAEMPANEWEIEDAEEEGILIQYLVTPTKVLGRDGQVVGLECVRMELGEPDASGRRRPAPITGSEFTVEADTVIMAVGQTPDLSFLAESGIEVTRAGTIVVDPQTLQTSRPGVFAGGDTASGPATVIEAVAAGKRAALSIHEYLSEEHIPFDRRAGEPVVEFNQLGARRGWVRDRRRRVPKLPVEERIKSFAEVELGLSAEEAIEEANRCLDCGLCSECRECERVCKAKAINHDQVQEIVDLQVGAIVVATGFDPYDVSALKEYGFGKIPNVITSLQYERLISASGPTSGDLRRPSDGQHPHAVAFIQCVGSRDVNYNPYCSSVCCMFATKEAILANEHYPGLKSYVFYTDLRAGGKRFQEYITRAREEYQVTYIRGRPGAIGENAETGNPIVRYEDTTARRLQEMEVGLVVLCQALVPRRDQREAAKLLGIELDEYGFVRTPARLSRPVDTSVPGIFTCGYCASPQDIPDSVAQASGAAARVAELLSNQ